MSDTTKSVIEQEINQSKKFLAQHNDADSVVTKIKSQVTALIKETVDAANSTPSIDDRIKHLVTGLQTIMTFVEDYEQQHLLQSSQMKQNVTLLQTILQKVDAKIEKEKKDLEPNQTESIPKDI